MRVTADALRQIRGGHPWLFDSSITSVSHDGAPGDLAVVFDGRRRFAAIGLWDPGSPVRMRILHAGEPTPVDDDFWTARLAAAIERRRALEESSATTAYRLVHGENDGLPGLVVDRYDRVTVMKIYSPAWFAHLAAIVPLVEAATGAASVVLRLGRNVARGPTHGCADGMVVAGELDEPVGFLENGLRFETSPTAGQKTGHFLDQRDNRARVGELSRGCAVLDVFSCTGGFALHAAAGGARSVHLVDRSRHALAAADRNFWLNHRDPAVSACPVSRTTGDAFEVMDQLAAAGRHFDLVVVDPPSFASRQDAVPGALQAYGHLTRLAVDLLTPGGTLVQASCSSRVPAAAFFTTVHEAARDRGRSLEVLARTGHPVDHPIGFSHGEYLKALFATVGDGHG